MGQECSSFSKDIMSRSGDDGAVIVQVYRSEIVSTDRLKIIARLFIFK
jgi:hypothetical protein